MFALGWAEQPSHLGTIIRLWISSLNVGIWISDLMGTEWAFAFVKYCATPENGKLCIIRRGIWEHLSKLFLTNPLLSVWQGFSLFYQSQISHNKTKPNQTKKKNPKPPNQTKNIHNHIFKSLFLRPNSLHWTSLVSAFLAILVVSKLSSFQLFLLQLHKGAAEAWLKHCKNIVRASEVRKAKACSTPPTTSIPVLSPRTLVMLAKLLNDW